MSKSIFVFRQSQYFYFQTKKGPPKMAGLIAGLMGGQYLVENIVSLCPQHFGNFCPVICGQCPHFNTEFAQLLPGQLPEKLTTSNKESDFLF
jgi:hypothetical protein